ncbi:MAG: hypothetical protein ACOY3I_01720 [Verrucomicrobiota bacterium]
MVGAAIEMLVALMFFLSGLALAWGISLALGSRYSGWGASHLPSWLPARSMANHWVCNLDRSSSLFFILFSIACILAGSWLHNVVSVFLFCGALVILGPVPACIAWKIREEMKHGAKEYIFYNAVRPPGTQQRDLAFFIEDDEWASMPSVTPQDVKFWQQYHVTDGLYICPAENDVLQSIDSLNLYKYIVNPDHPRMLHALARALSTTNPSHTSQSPHARRTFIQLQTQAQDVLSSKTRSTPQPEIPPSFDFKSTLPKVFSEHLSQDAPKEEDDDFLWWDKDEDDEDEDDENKEASS